MANYTVPKTAALQAGATSASLDKQATAARVAGASGAAVPVKTASFVNTDIQYVKAPPVYTFVGTDITNASPVVGAVDLRTVTITERLKPSPSVQARLYSVDTRSSTLDALVDYARQLQAEDGELPGLFDGVALHGVDGDEFLKDANGGNSGPRFRVLRDFIADDVLRAKVRLAPTIAELPDKSVDEARHFAGSVDLGDNSVALMRQMEGRIKVYRDIATRAQSVLEALRRGLAAANNGLTAAGNALAEARSDVATALALQAEEQARIDAVNARRAEVLATEVKFLAYLRPRESDNLNGAARRTLDPALAAAPVPQCLRAHTDVPDELDDLLSAVREAPAAWFRASLPLLDRFDKIELLGRVLQTAQVRSQITVLQAPKPSRDALSSAVAKVALRQVTAVSTLRARVQTLDLTRVTSVSWQVARRQAEDVVSLGDLIDGTHGRSDVARSAATAFAQFGEVCTCLHAEFCGVSAIIRLAWAEALSEYDAPPALRNLAGLPRWNEIDSVARRRMQAFVDWLFGQLRGGNAQADDLINDVVQMCLLLASHAPIDRLLAGRLTRPTVARPGLRIPLTAFDPGQLRVGMQALVYRGSELVTRAVVDDLDAADLSARVIHTVGESVELDPGMRVQFAAAATVSASVAKLAVRR